MKTALLCLLGLSGAVIAAQTSDDLQQTASRQEQIRGDAQGLVARLDEVIAEYTRNGLANGEDFEALKAVREALGSLSDDEMEQVVTLLNGAGGDREQMAKAYEGQKDISVRLKQILAAHSLYQDIESLASGVRQLADRQSANLSAAIDTGQLAAEDQSANGQTAVTASEQAQQSEQQAIAEEVKLIADKLTQIAPEGKYRDAATELEHVEPEASAAADSLGSGKLDDAESVEKAAREQLDEVARALLPAGVPEAPPSREAAELADLTRQQRDLLAKTTTLNNALKKLAGAETPEAADKAMLDQLKNPATPLARSLAQNGITATTPPDQIRAAAATKTFLQTRAETLKRQQQALQPQLAALSAAQAALAAKAQMVRDDLRAAAQEAAGPVDAALPRMTSAQQELAAANGTQAIRDELESANQLSQAERLAAQNGAGRAPAATPEQQMRQLQAGVNGLTARENASVQQGDSLKTGPQALAANQAQEAMAAKAQDLAQLAAAEGSPAAQALKQAADAFQNAAGSMGSGSDPTATEAAQQSALQCLAQADQQLAEQAAGIASQKKDLADMGRQMAALGRLAQQQRQIGVEAAKAGGKPKQIARAQAGLQKSAENLQKSMSAGAPDAADALGRADSAMGDAADKLGGDTPGDAQSPQQDALGALYKAQDALAGRMQSLAQGLGQSFAQGLAETSAALAKARQALDSGDAGMQSAAQQLAAAAAQPQAIPQAARDALRAAQESFDGAAAGGSAQGESQAAQATRAIDAAQSAMDQTEAGIAGLSSPSSPSGAPSGNGPQAGSSEQSNTASQQSNPTSGQTPASGKTGANEKSWSDQAGAATAAGNGAQGPGEFQGLPDRDRAALQQSQAEKYPQEYGSMVESYMRNLSTDSGEK